VSRWIRRRTAKEANHGNRYLLSARREWPPRRYATEYSEKFPPPHARPHSDGGMIPAQTSALIEAETGFAAAT